MTPGKRGYPCDRRALLELGGLGLVGLALGCGSRQEPASAEADPSDDTGLPHDTDLPEACPLTDPDIEGPFYIEGVPVRSDLDRYGDTGTRLTFTGRVLDASCAPLAGAVVELWQADPDGDYDNSSPEMRYRGQIDTDLEGRFAFQTLYPGLYLNGARYRPAHLHIKVFVGGAERLTTQLYFEGDPYLADDPWADPDRTMAAQETGPDAVACTYDLVV